jgi:hypothetical protein
MTAKLSYLVRATALCIVSLTLASPSSADITIRQKTISSGLGGFADATTVSAVTVAGDRSRSEDEYTYTGRFKTLVGKKPKQSVTITRVDRGLVWTLEPQKKQYKEMTFAEMKEAMDKAAREIEQAQAEDMDSQQPGPNDQGMKFTVEVKKTGAKQEINGFACEQVIVSCIGKPEKPQPGEEGAELRFVLDQWLTPALPGQDELAAYYRRLADAMGIEQQFAGMSLMARRMYGNAMKEMAAKFKDVKGYAIRSAFTVEGQGGSGQQTSAAQAKADTDKAYDEAKKGQAQSEKVQDAADAATIGSQAATGQDTKGAIGGFLGRKVAQMVAKKAEAKAAKAAEGGSGGKGPFFKMVTEVTAVSAGSAVAADFDVPDGYKKTDK